MEVVTVGLVGGKGGKGEKGGCMDVVSRLV